ncbi:hypothetical protein RhiirC2_870319 [Rhizophagus irregularis]|uniref:Ubiquitin C n=1 Tax=Rhizophagus irregularis TaxID=588596 RepID=A0A2N1MKH8_9GLOM|nr:hypothetical protein RhiirC2_870319 [Rhizophagus irregularis]
MYLISMPNPPPIFSIRIIEELNLYRSYKANVTMDTTVELLLKCFKAHIKDELHDYKLLYNGQDLQNTDTLKNLGLKERDYIRAVQIPFKLYVKTQDRKIIELHVTGKVAISMVKQMVHKHVNIPVYKQRLLFDGKKLHDFMILKLCDIQKGSILELAIASFKLYVKKKDGRVLKLYLNEDDTIHDVKQMVWQRTRIPVYKQCLLFCGEQLHDSSTLKSCNIQNESTFELTIASFKLNVKMQDGKVIVLYVTEKNTINEVKQMIQEREGIPRYKQRLFSYEYQLRSSSTLKCCKIEEEATLKLIISKSNSLIHVKTLTGKNIILSVCENLFPQVEPVDVPSEKTLQLVLRLRGGMFQETSGRIDFNALPPLMQYMQVPGRYLHDKVHAGIACNYCGKSEWKGARYKCSECLDYDLCYECIKISKLVHDEQHNFSEILDPENQNDFPKDIPEEMLTLLQEEEKRRFSSEIQQQYYKVGSDPTSEKDWMDVTDQMQHNLVREFGYSDEAVHSVPKGSDNPAFHTTQVYVRNNIVSRGNLKEGMLAPDCPLVPLTNDKTIIQLHSLYKPGRPFVLLAGSYTCPLYRYISHVLNDIYSLYNENVDFYMIQIRKAHASDVWPIGNIVEVKEHRTLEERLTAARKMVKATQLEIHVLADTMDNTFLNLYSLWPFRFFVIKDGVLKLVGLPKEARYDTTDLVNCLDALLDKKSSESDFTQKKECK